MERKLIKHGYTTLMVSIPKKWINNQGLNKGDTVDISTTSDKVIITTKERKEKLLENYAYFKEANYDHIRTVLGELYRKGYKKINITYENPRCFYFIELMVNSLHGFEIIDQEEKTCVIKNITNELNVDTEEILKRITSITNLEFLIVREYLVEGEKNKEEEIRTIRDDCWKFRNLLYLHLKEVLLFSAYDNYFMAHLLEYNASFLYWLYRSYNNSKISKPKKEFIELYDLIHNYFKESNKRIKNKDKEYIDFIQKNKYDLLKKCENYSLKNSKDRFLVIYLAMLVQNIHNPKSIIV